METHLPVIGVIRPPGRNVGQVEPAVGGLGGIWIQQIEDGKVARFQPASFGAGRLLELSSSAIGKRYRSISLGDPALFAFALPDGRVLFGSAEELCSQIDEAWPVIAGHLLALAEAERFLRDTGIAPPEAMR